MKDKLLYLFKNLLATMMVLKVNQPYLTVGVQQSNKLSRKP